MAGPLKPAAIAGDIYPTWAKIIAEATSRVVILTPYLDELVPKLLSKSTIDPSCVTVITDLSPDSSAREYLRQLKTLSVLISQSVNVRTLPRLHAKVLIVDDAYFTVGSQNFTTYARGSRETNVSILVEPATAAFLETLWEWIDESVPIDEELLAALTAAIEEQAEQAKDALSGLQDAVEQFMLDWNARQARDESERLKALEIASPFRLAQGAARARLQLIDTGWDMYWTLLCDPGSDLTAWSIVGEDGRTKTAIRRLNMCPIFLSDTHQMALGRIGKTRITYVRESVRWKRAVTLGVFEYRVTLRFPKAGTRTCNIKFDFEDYWEDGPTVTLDAHFDGSSLRFLGTRPQPGHHRDDSFTLISNTILEELSTHESQQDFIRTCLVPFKFESMDLSHKNASSFFSDSTYRLALGALSSSPVLVATPVN